MKSDFRFCDSRGFPWRAREGRDGLEARKGIIWGCSGRRRKGSKGKEEGEGETLEVDSFSDRRVESVLRERMFMFWSNKRTDDC